MTRDARYLLTSATVGFSVAICVAIAAHNVRTTFFTANVLCRVLVPEASLARISRMNGHGIGMLGFLNAALYGFVGLFVGLTRDEFEKRSNADPSCHSR